MIFPGGIPVRNDEDTIVGAVGVSGGTIDEDQACAQAGTVAFGS